MEISQGDLRDFMDNSEFRVNSHNQLVEWLSEIVVNSNSDELMRAALSHELNTLWVQKEIGIISSMILASIVAFSDNTNEFDIEALGQQQPPVVVRFVKSLVDAFVASKNGCTVDDIARILSEKNDFV